MPAWGPARFSACIAIVLFSGSTGKGHPAPADKPETWTEVDTPHFTILCNDGEKTGRRIAEQFEQVRLVYSKALSSNLRLDPGVPIVIFAVKNEKSLSQIIPEYWAQKGHTHPSGIFLPNPEKNYIALRTDGEGQFPYLPVYHEYVHLIINLNFQRFPLWLNEGFATFLGSMTLVSKGATLGKPNDSELYVLSKTKLLPLEVLFRVGHDSPYYNEADKTNIFYSESWALVHYLMTDPARKKDRQLGKYIEMTESGADPVDSAKAAFGDLGQLKKELDGYVSRTSYTAYIVQIEDSADSKSFPARIVPPAEVDAALGEFDIHRGQMESARGKIEEAIRFDPNLAVAQESMGLLLFRENKREEAQKYFSRAASLDSKNALTYYYDGMLLLRGQAEEEDPDEAMAALEKAVSLKPGLASAWDALAMIYSRESTWDKALSAEERALNALPGEVHYQFNRATILAGMGKYDDARSIALGIGKSADPALASAAAQFLEQIDRAQRFDSGRVNRTDEAAARPLPPKVERTEALELGTPAAASDRGTAEDSVSAAPEHAPVTVTSTHAYSMIGTIAAVDCAPAPQMQITLQAAAIVMHLHAADFTKIEVKAEGGDSSPARLSCSQFRGKSVRIRYQLASNKPWDGEVESVEFRNSP